MIVSAFLALGEGYEILPTMEGRSKELILIPMPPNGFSVNYLKVFSGKPRDTSDPCNGTSWRSSATWKIKDLVVSRDKASLDDFFTETLNGPFFADNLTTKT